MLKIISNVLQDNTLNIIKEQLKSYPIILYINGTPDHPLCPNTSNAIKILEKYKISYNYVDVLHNISILREIINISHSRNFPQIFIQGEFLGSTDILLKLHLSQNIHEFFDIKTS